MKPALDARGRSPVTWRSYVRTLPSTDLGDLLGPAERVVVVAPHPDDEILGVGATLCRIAQCGLPIHILAVTDGEASHPGSRRWGRNHLRAKRACERRKGLRTLRLSPVPVTRLRYRDGGVGESRAALTDAIATTIRPHDCVFVTWRGDGHPDHEACGFAAARACQTIGARLVEVPVWMWHWATPDDPRVPWIRACRLALTRHERSCKRRALAAHRSQLTPDPTSGRAAVVTTTLAALANAPWEVLFA
jgi:LmbE family N-acetylglucosaminyl deacetylase